MQSIVSCASRALLRAAQTPARLGKSSFAGSASRSAALRSAPRSARPFVCAAAQVRAPRPIGARRKRHSPFSLRRFCALRLRDSAPPRQHHRLHYLPLPRPPPPLQPCSSAVSTPCPNLQNINAFSIP